MSIRVVFPDGVTSVTAPSLYQWDYGQSLEIEVSPTSPAIVEIHFSCLEMDEALVQPCAITNGVATASIPDSCLEQTTPITAWIYEINGNSGNTTKSVKIPMVARPKPSVCSGDVSPEIENRYAEMITEMNSAVASIQSGDITASYAVNARHAQDADRAQQADLALFANEAQVAEHSESAITDGEGNNIVATYMPKSRRLPVVIKSISPASSGWISGYGNLFIMGTLPETQLPDSISSIGLCVEEYGSSTWTTLMRTFHLTGQKCIPATSNGYHAVFRLEGSVAEYGEDTTTLRHQINMEVELFSGANSDQLNMYVLSGEVVEFFINENTNELHMNVWDLATGNKTSPSRYTIRNAYIYFR